MSVQRLITQYTDLSWVLIHLKATQRKTCVWLCWPSCLILEILQEISPSLCFRQTFQYFTEREMGKAATGALQRKLRRLPSVGYMEELHGSAIHSQLVVSARLLSSPVLKDKNFTSLSSHLSTISDLKRHPHPPLWESFFRDDSPGIKQPSRGWGVTDCSSSGDR